MKFLIVKKWIVDADSHDQALGKTKGKPCDDVRSMRLTEEEYRYLMETL